MEISCATDVPILVSPMYCRRLMPESKLEFAAQVVVDPKFHGSLEALLLLTVGWLCLYSCPSLSQPFAIGTDIWQAHRPPRKLSTLGYRKVMRKMLASQRLTAARHTPCWKRVIPQDHVHVRFRLRWTVGRPSWYYRSEWGRLTHGRF